MFGGEFKVYPALRVENDFGGDIYPVVIWGERPPGILRTITKGETIISKNTYFMTGGGSFNVFEPQMEIKGVDGTVR